MIPSGSYFIEHRNIEHRNDLIILKSKMEIEKARHVSLSALDDVKISHREHKRMHSDETSDDTSPYAEHGATIDRTDSADLRKPLNAGLRWPRIRHLCRDAFSE